MTTTISAATEPLDPATWFGRLQKLLIDAEKNDDSPPESLIRQGCYLVRLAPGPFRDLIPVDIDEDAIEAMLACGAYESAVMNLIGENTSFVISKTGGDDRIRAEMSLDGGAVGCGEHASCARAMIQAGVRCMALVAGVEMRPSPIRRGPRKFRFGLPPNSTAH